MNHWYGWIALVVVLVLATFDTGALAVNAWRMPRQRLRETWWSRSLCVWAAVWWTDAAALVAC